MNVLSPHAADLDGDGDLEVLSASFNDDTIAWYENAPPSLPTGTVLANGYLVGPGVDLAGADLTGADLAGADLTGADLTGATLTGVTSGGLTGTPSALPTGTILANGYLVGPGANLTGADLTGADLAGADLTGADLTGATVTGVTSGGLTGTPSALPTGTILANGYLVGPGANLTGADLTGADLAGADLTGADLTGATLTGVTSGGLTGTPSALPTGTVLANGYLVGPGVDLAGAPSRGSPWVFNITPILGRCA